MERIRFILSTSADFFSASQATDESTVRAFFESEEITLLAATAHEKKIIFHHRIPQDCDNCLLYYKIPKLSKSVQEDSGSASIGLLSLEGGMVKSMYNSVARIFSPNVSQRSIYTPEVANILDTLQITLGSSLGFPESGIISLHDEVNYWQQKSTQSSTKSDRDKAKSFANLLEKLDSEIRREDIRILSNLEEFLDNAHTTLDEVWRLPGHFPQNRMADVMDVICLNILEICIDNLTGEDVWSLDNIHVSTAFAHIGELAGNWIQICDSLTRLFWPNYAQHPWLGESHVPRQAKAFTARLEEVKNIKNLYRQIVTLFTDNTHLIDSVNRMFQPFRNLNILDIQPLGEKRWRSALMHFEKILEPIDEKIANVLKGKLHRHLDNPRQVVHIFSKFDIISTRPMVLELLTAEREHFLQSLQFLIKDLQVALAQSGDSVHENSHISPICWECRWLRVVEHQIDEISKISHVVANQENHANVFKQLTDLRAETQNLLKVNFDSWCEQSLAAVKSGELTIRDDRSVVEFEKTGRQLMRVTFNAKLISFCYDVKEFERQGYKIPLELRDSASHAVKFISYARLLQQVATFHNTIGDRMIPCQRPIMLKNAVELSNLVRSESVAWNDEESVKRYIGVLQGAVQKLSKDNAILAGYHEQAKRIIVKLMSTDLQRQAQIWKDEMRHLRDLVAQIESQGYTNLDAFKLHLDHQLYKVLEYQYVSGVLNLNNKLPDIYVDIVFRQQQLQFRPPLEEIRAKYFLQLRRFIERPLNFRGLSERSGDLFKVMVERNRHYFGSVYHKAEDLFRNLKRHKDSWFSWVALGCVDLEELCKIHLSTWQDWDRNFRSCKHFSQQVAKIQNSEERIDCIVINLSPLRSDIEFISRRYWEALTNSLRSSILEDISVLEDFLHTSLQVLQNIPLDENGISEAGAKYEKITSELPKMTELIKSVQGKDTCLAGWCKERVTSLANLLVGWDQLQPLIDNHHTVLQRQIDIMKDHLTGQIENLTEEAEKFLIRWEATLAEMEANEKADLSIFRERQQQWEALKEKKEHLQANCEKFNVPLPEKVEESFKKVQNDVTELGKQWEHFERFMKEFDEIGAEEWTVYRRRPYILTDFLGKWKNDQSIPVTSATTRIHQMIEMCQNLVPVLQNLQSDALTEKHWARIFHLLGKSPKPTHDILLKDILSSGETLSQQTPEIQGIVRQASSEQIVRQALTELEQWGVTASLKLTSHKDSKGEGVSLIRDFQEILNKIGDNQCLLQSAKNSAAFEAFSDQAEIWESRLATLDRILSSLSQIQRKWIYLEPIFSGGTLRSEEVIFLRIDKDFRYIMREIVQDPRALSVVKISNIANVIESLENQLSRCQNTLTAYITSKRNAFPRFYFLGDDDLLEILGQASKEIILQKHIKKLFPGVHHLGISPKDGELFIDGIHSAEEDAVSLRNVIHISGPVEDWLNQLVMEIKFTLRELVRRCVEIKDFSEEHIAGFPIQVLTLARAINFTRATEKAITSMSIGNLLKSTRADIERFTLLAGKTQSSLTQLKIRSLLVDLVHHATILEDLQRNNVTNIQDWMWLQQLKFYIDRNSATVTSRMVYTEFEYSYEFLGNPSKLVNTSLTHRCYLTLTQSMHLGLGGNPFGPAGTGKTECVKALGAMLGRLVLVFNCNENVDSAAIGLILSGLARCGAFGCFDEFNRLQEATLSAISMQIQPLQQALKEKRDTVTILDEPIPLNPHCGIFVTLNPAGEEYGGRQKLPANIQSLFRPIVMQEPKPKEIARVLLFVEGFENADEIGERMVELFTLARKILSPQRHYDWGLRELKTVLTACGKSLRERRSTSLSVQEEMEIAVHAVRSNTMSKLTLADCKLFDALIEDVFPNIGVTDFREKDLQNALQESFKSVGLIANERQVEKCMELQEQLSKRMGVVVVGPPASGKTTLITILKQALMSLGRVIRTYTIAPKSMSRKLLLGHLDPDTRQWNDGVLTTTAVAVNSEDSSIQSWIICDGDVDPEWIEALNSVLDDNKLLTLPSGWRIQFGNNVNFIFETHDLSHASPATISRMGIINLSARDLPGDLLLQAWLLKQTNEEILKRFLDQYLRRGITWIDKNVSRPVATASNNMILCALQAVTDTASKDEFCVQLVQGLGASLTVEARRKFSQQIFEWADIYLANRSDAELVSYNNFRDTIEVHELEGTAGSTSLIKTPIAKANIDVLRHFLKGDSRAPFLVVGPAGCGKTLLLETTVAEFAGYQLVTINCSAQLTVSYVLYVLKQHFLVISGIRGREYKPKFNRIVVYLRNIHLCPVDEWGTSEVVELLLQLIQRSGFYADTLEWISVTGLQVCGSFSSTFKSSLSPRFLSVTRFLVMDYPSEKDMNVIVENQFSPIFSRFKTSKVRMEKIAEAIIAIYQEIKTSFTIDQRSHYVFTPKMITRLLSNLSCYPAENLPEALHHEACRMLRDRLTSDEEIVQFDEIFSSATRQFYSPPSKSVFFVPSSVKTTQLQSALAEEFLDRVQRSIGICNSEHIAIDSPITDQLLTTVAAICRVICRPETHMVIAGLSGSGRRECLYIAGVLLQTKIHTLQASSNYSIGDFFSDLKIAMQSAALEDQNTVLLIDHTWIEFLPTILEPIEALLEGSEVPDIFGDDLETIANPLRSAAQLEGYQESLASYFLKRVGQNLHLIISLESSSPNIDELFTKYPSLYRNAEIFFLHPLSSEDLEKYSKNYPESVENFKEFPVPKYFSEVLTTSGKWNQSPQRMKQLIIGYKKISFSWSKRISSRMENLKAGVEKLSSAYSVVASLKNEATQQEEAVTEKRRLAAESLEMISATMRSATDQRTDLLELKQKTEESSRALVERKKAIELELKEVEPLLKEAIAAVGQIKTEALSEIRSLRAPPETIRDILEGVLRLMGIRDTSWNSMKTFLAKRGVKEDIRSLDPARIAPENYQAVEKLLIAKAESFEIKNAKRASAAAAPLASWVIANVQYAKVVQSVKPLEREQNELKRNLDEAETQMKSLMSGLDDVDSRVKELSNQLNMYTQEAAVLEIKLNDVRSTLASAETLVDKLSSEYRSWSEQMQELQEELDSLSIKAFLVSLSINFLSHLYLEERSQVLSTVIQTTELPPFDLTQNLVTEQEKIMWESMGLTPDAQSLQNAGLLTKILSLPLRDSPIPLLLDPSGNSLQWFIAFLRTHEKSFEVSSQSAERFAYTLELAIRFGKILIVRDVEIFLPSLLSVIISKIHVRFNKKLLQVGNKLIDLHDDFHLILTTSLDKFHLSADIEALVSPIPFTTTISGLTDQLMSKSILLKRPDLEEKRIKLLQSEGSMLKEREKLQERLLQELSTAQGDILKNEKLISSLNAVKESSESIDASLRESTAVRKKLMEDYSKYQSLCAKSAHFFMGIAGIYPLSVNLFSDLFTETLGKEAEYDEERIFSQLIHRVYMNLSRSVSKQNYLELALHICKNAYPDKVPEKEWELFITNFISTEDSSGYHFPEWLKRELIPKLTTLRSSHVKLYEVLQLENRDLWSNFMGGGKAELPVRVSDFQRILITQILRPDLMMQAIRESVTRILGFNTMSVVQPSIGQLAQEAKSDKPILIISSTGTDPSKDLRGFVTEKMQPEKFVEISVGKGQEQHSILALRRAAESGTWICLKNIHLLPKWIKTLETELASLSPHKDFRLWLICESTQDFSEAFVSKCLKLLFELPNGVKFKVQRLLKQWETLMTSKRDPRLVKLFFTLLLLNAVLQERRNYIPQGFTKWYDFSESDLRAGIDCVKWMETTFAVKMEWPILHGLLDCIAFGGRIDNVQDHQVLLYHLRDFFGDALLTSRWIPPNFTKPAPQSTSIQDYYNFIHGLTDADDPELFGLAATTNVSRDLLYCRNLLKHLRSTYYKIDDQENLEKRIRPILATWKKLVSGSTLMETCQNIPEDDHNSDPWITFILSEIRLAGNLFSTIHGMLTNLHNSIRESGTEMSPSERAALQILCENQVPLQWRKLWLGPRLATEYMKAVSVRAHEAERRMQARGAASGWPEAIDFATVFSLESFLASLKLATARKRSTSTCHLTFHATFDVGETLEEPSVSVAPLLIDGAALRGGRLAFASRRTDDTRTPHFRITYTSEAATGGASAGIPIPLYANSNRERALGRIAVATADAEAPDALATYAGVALVVPDAPL
ncbi:cytoplasmic dynein 2 heavy chain 1 [Phlebotomus argentipes]|uniref:cytoplasmic dynein 2 heavy chain 1 n=1 Tax=Phlebotomus argentipes TaxID=94469 RepID=UPI002892FD26|nr:cytoplasmic dynein 2 heavy chain 1 [Phlebotomus argentipes]